MKKHAQGRDPPSACSLSQRLSKVSFKFLLPASSPGNFVLSRCLVPRSGTISNWFSDHFPEPLSIVPSSTQICVIRPCCGWKRFWVVPLEEALYKSLWSSVHTATINHYFVLSVCNWTKITIIINVANRDLTVAEPRLFTLCRFSNPMRSLQRKTGGSGFGFDNGGPKSSTDRGT